MMIQSKAIGRKKEGKKKGEPNQREKGREEG